MKTIRAIYRYLNRQFEAEQTQWFAWVPFLFGLGIALYFSLPQEPTWWWSLAAVEIWLLLFYLYRYKHLNLFFTAGLIILCGFINIQMRTMYQQKFVAFEPPRITYLSGRINDISYNENGVQRLLLNHVSDWDKSLIGTYRITATGNKEPLQIGQCVEMVGTIFPPSRIPILNGFQLNRKYFYEGLSGIGYTNSEIFSIKCAQDLPILGFKARLNKIRQKISNRITQILPANESGIVNALLVGEKSQISKQIINDYRGAGLAHFLAVSGLHLGSIAGLIFFLIRWLLALFPSIALRIDTKKPAAIAAILFSGLYLLVSGMAIPAERAFIMTTVVLIGVLFHRQAISMRMVSFAALTVLVLMPQALISVSFQMSFAAVYALVSFYEKFDNSIIKKRKIHGGLTRVWWYLASIVIADLVASLATAPFAMYHFKQLSIYTSLGNLLAGPLIGLYLMPLVLICLAMLPFGLALWPLKGLGIGINLLNQITAEVTALPHSLLPVTNLPLWGFILIVIGGFWLCVWRQSWRHWGFLPIIIGLSSLFFISSPDMIFAPSGKAIALRDKTQKLVLLPFNTDSWLKRVWQENLHINMPNSTEQEFLQQIPNGKIELPNNFSLQCQNGKCIYQEKVEFDLNGHLVINGKKLDLSSGGYVFINQNKITFQPLWNAKQQRLWQKNEQSNKQD